MNREDSQYDSQMEGYYTQDQYDDQGYYQQEPLSQPVPIRPNTGIDPRAQTPPGYYQQNPNMQNYGQYQQMGQNNNMGFAPAFPATFQDFQGTAAAQLGVQLGQNAMQAGSVYLEQNYSRFVDIPKLKHYFNVSNSYVFNKIRLLLFPFRHKPWSRQTRQEVSGGPVDSFCPPREDINAPDLYIPVTALATYILVIGFKAGKEGFKPELLGKTASTALGVVLFEVLLLKLGCYLFSVTSDGQLLDLISYCGYKFIGIILSVVSRWLLPKSLEWVYWVVFIYTCLATGFFLLRSLRHIVLPDSSVSAANPFRKRRVNLLFGIAAIQLISCWVLAA